MPSRICDKSPCHYLDATLKMLAAPGDEDKLDIVVEPTNPTNPKRKVTLWYCPFCGTRIDPSWLKSVRKKGHG